MFKRKGSVHGKKGFVILTKSFVKIGITKTFCYNNKVLSSVNKSLVAAANFLAAATKILSVVPNYVAVRKPFFSVSASSIASLASSSCASLRHCSARLSPMSMRQCLGGNKCWRDVNGIRLCEIV